MHYLNCFSIILHLRGSCDIAGDQCSLQSRQLAGLSNFKGIVTYAGQHEGADSQVASPQCVRDKVCSLAMSICIDAYRYRDYHYHYRFVIMAVRQPDCIGHDHHVNNPHSSPISLNNCNVNAVRPQLCHFKQLHE